MTKTPERIADDLLNLFESEGQGTYHGEEVTQLEHALQCAELAVDANGDDETVIAALLHDVGHICAPDAPTIGDMGVADHEGLGADYLRERGFSERVAQLVQGHVEAKRYLTYKNPDYFAKLSEASVETLRHQGGPMNEGEGKAFEDDPLADEKLRMRSWDEQAKRVGRHVPPLETYREMIVRHLKTA